MAFAPRLLQRCDATSGAALPQHAGRVVAALEVGGVGGAVGEVGRAALLGVPSAAVARVLARGGGAVLDAGLHVCEEGGRAAEVAEPWGGDLGLVAAQLVVAHELDGGGVPLVEARVLGVAQLVLGGVASRARHGVRWRAPRARPHVGVSPTINAGECTGTRAE